LGLQVRHANNGQERRRHINTLKARIGKAKQSEVKRRAVSRVAIGFPSLIMGTLFFDSQGIVHFEGHVNELDP